MKALLVLVLLMSPYVHGLCDQAAGYWSHAIAIEETRGCLNSDQNSRGYCGNKVSASLRDEGDAFAALADRIAGNNANSDDFESICL